MRAKLRAVNDQLKFRRHQPIPEQGTWLASVVRGHFAYYAVPGNIDAVSAFCTQATRNWLKALRRRSQKTSLTWARMDRLATRWLPPARVLHPYPEQRFDVRTSGRSPVRQFRTLGSVRGAARTGGPYRNTAEVGESGGWPGGSLVLLVVVLATRRW
jgi:hypothetical protein